MTENANQSTPGHIRLADDQLAELARLIAAELGRGGSSATPLHDALVDATTLAGLLGVHRSWIYQHAAELGGKRLGNGSKRGTPLRFDPARARAAFTELSTSTDTPKPHRRQRKPAQTTASILQNRARRLGDG